MLKVLMRLCHPFRDSLEGGNPYCAGQDAKAGSSMWERGEMKDAVQVYYCLRNDSNRTAE